ncbi:MAG: hypothetical protein RLZZ461_1691, partial [Planctomycetota bacterium]
MATSKKKKTVRTSAAEGSGAVATPRKKKRRAAPAVDPADRAKVDARTVASIEGLAGSIVAQSLRHTDPSFDVPTRAKSNVHFDPKARVLRMGDAAQQRLLFNLGQAKKFMQTVLVADGCRDLVRAGKTLSLRGMYYKSLHTIAGTKEKTFDGQDESDAVLEDLEVTLDALRENLHVFAKKRGTMVGNITVFDNGDEIDCRRMGT